MALLLEFTKEKINYNSNTGQVILLDINIFDADGNAYTEIYINDKLWLKEPSKATSARDGTAVQYWNQNGDPLTGNTYGRLYKWGTSTGNTNSTNIAPQNYHCATQADWLNMLTYIAGITGGTTSSSGTHWNAAGSFLKEAGTKHWKTPNTGAYNAINFSIFGGGNALTPPTWTLTYQNFLSNMNIWEATPTVDKGWILQLTSTTTDVWEPNAGQTTDIGAYIFFVHD